MNTATIPQQNASSSRFQTKRALVAYMSDQEKHNILIGQPPLLGEELAKLEQTIAQYNAARMARPKYTPITPIITESSPLLDRICSRPDIISAFKSTGMPWRPVMVDLRKILSFQSVVRIDNLADRIGTALNNPDALLELCFPSNANIEASIETSPQGYTITTTSPHLMYIPSLVPVTIGNQMTPVPAFTPQTNPGFFHVVCYQGRYFIRDGYHRAVGLLYKNTDEQIVVPCILVEAQLLSQTGWQPGQSGMIAEAILLSDYLPHVSDFWDETVSCDFIQKSKRRIFRMRLDIFEIDN